MPKAESRTNHCPWVFNQMLLIHHYTLHILLATLKALIWKLSLLQIVCWHILLHSQHLRDCCSVLMLSFRKWLPKTLRRVLRLQKECSTLHSQKAVMIWTIVDMFKSSRGCSDDCRSFDQFPYLKRYTCHLVFVLILDLVLQSYIDIHLLFYFGPFISNVYCKSNFSLV